jgi:transposase
VVKKDKKKISIEISEVEINRRIDQIEAANIDEELRQFMIDALMALVRLDEIIGMQDTTILRLRKIFNKKTEKQIRAEEAQAQEDISSDVDKKHPRGNNKGRNGQKEYPNAPRIEHAHESLKAGDVCPECQKGKLYKFEPGIYIRITGKPPVSAVVHEVQKFRCNACLKIFEADFAEKNTPKYDAGVHALVALLKYAASVPFYRLAKIQKYLYVPMPPSTQWDLMEELAKQLYPVWLQLLKFAGEAEKFQIDDTTAKVLSLIRENKKLTPERKGMYTTGLLAKVGAHQIMLYLTGRNHAGENLDNITKDRTSQSVPHLMSDALASNDIADIKVIRSYCLAHARRKFFDLKSGKFIIKQIEQVYKAEAYCKDNKLSPEERLAYHQEHSKLAMDGIFEWCNKQIDDKEVEPNSDLIEPINYTLKHWDGLTKFLQVAGAEIDNNALENHLRLSVLNRKNSLFFKTENGAMIGDIITSFIKTCDAAKINPFDYLVWIQENKDQVRKSPSEFLPWHFKLPDCQS